jgi:hypothetical protein
MVGRRRAFLPEMDLAIDDDHWRFLFRRLASRKARPNATPKYGRRSNKGRAACGGVSTCCKLASPRARDRARHLTGNTQRIAWLSAASALSAGARPL